MRDSWRIGASRYRYVSNESVGCSGMRVGCCYGGRLLASQVGSGEETMDQTGRRLASISSISIS